MSYHGLGAGPGPVETYRVDLPFPWGADTELKLPIAAITQDALRAAERAGTAGLVPWDSINRRIEASMPVWIDQLQQEIDPYVNEVIGRITRRVTFVATSLVAASVLAAWWLKKRG